MFRFVSHPDYAKGDKSFIGKLLPNSTPQREDNIRVTFIPRQTGIAESFDVNDEILKDFTFYSEGYYEVPYREDFVLDEKAMANSPASLLARFETTVPDREYAGKKMEFMMKEAHIIVSGKDENREGANIFKIPSEWVSTPHLHIRHDKSNDAFYVAALGEKTILNEQELPKSNVDNLQWVSLPMNSKMVLNGIVGINIFKF